MECANQRKCDRDDGRSASLELYYSLEYWWFAVYPKRKTYLDFVSLQTQVYIVLGILF